MVKSASKKFYVGVAPGYVLPEDVKFSRTSSTNNSGKLEFEDGYSVGAFAGYHFNDYLRGEANLSYAKVDYDKATVNGIGSADIDGDVSATIGMISAVVAPLGKSAVSPLLGGGVGAAYVKDKVSSVAGVTTGWDNSETDLALSGMAGIEADVSSNVALGVRYNYYWIDTGGDGRDNFTAHNFSATAAVKF